MKSIELNIEKALFFAEKEFNAAKDDARQAITTLEEGSGAGNDFLGWVKLPSETPAELLDRINATAARLQENCDYVVCVGIGGPYQGAKAVDAALAGNFAYDYAPEPNPSDVRLNGQDTDAENTAQLEKLPTR